VENARELLIGSFDIFTTQMTMRTNEAMKVLTLVSFVWFPASVITVIFARKRRWI
jgi:Mg2+ and Co2+ transporter CorA